MRDFKRTLGFLKRGIIGLLQNKAERTPKINPKAEKIALGVSTKGNEINCYRIGKGQRKVIFVSGVHGNETGTVKLAYRLISWLSEVSKERFEDFSFFVAPCLNPDGYEIAIKNPDYFNGGRQGRFNGNNVDLNRNFDTPSFKKNSVWSFGKNYSEKVEVYCGEKGNSEIETKSLTDFILKENIKIFYAFHNAGRAVMGNNNDLSQRLVKLYCEKDGFEYVSDDDWKKLSQTGTAKEWSELHGIAYVEVEGSSRWASDWSIQKRGIEATLTFLLQERR